MKKRKLTKVMLSMALTAAMIVSAAAPAGVGVREAAAEETSKKIIDSAVQVVTFDTNAGIENMYASENSSKTVTDGERGKVLELGLRKRADRTRGVLIKNPFYGDTSLVETLADALKNNGVTYNGSSADLVTLHDQHGNPYLGLDVDTIPREDRTYPYPKYLKGVSYSAWVKVPETATKDTPIFTFTRESMEHGVGGLTINLGGNVTFFEGTIDVEGESSSNKNSIGFEYDKNKAVKSDLLSKKGSWVYLTVVIQNDWISVYYDGKPTEATIPSSYRVGKHFTKCFNKGFSYRGALQENPSEIYKNYRCLIDGFTQEEKDAGTFTDYSKYRFLNSKQDTIMEYILDEDTSFYIGGEKKSMAYNTAEYRDDVAGVRVDDLAFFNKPLTDAQVAQLYEEVKPQEATPAPTSTPEPTTTPDETETPEPTTTPDETETPVPTETSTTVPDDTETPVPTETPTIVPDETETPVPTETPTTTPDETETPAPKEYWYGDVDQSGVTTAEDALSILKHVVKLQVIEDEISAALADMNKDGQITAEDALEVLKVVVKLREGEIKTF